MPPSERMDFKMEKRYYIAYGSNLNIRQMRMRCPGARIIGTSVIEGYRLLFKGSRTGSYLTIEPQEGASIPVAAWAVTEEDEAALDRYEGFPNFYYKKEMELPLKGIKTGKVRLRKVFVYIMHEDRPLGVPSGFYMETCRQTYHGRPAVSRADGKTPLCPDCGTREALESIGVDGKEQEQILETIHRCYGRG